ncbi:hypothetical protein II906_01180 [bacterium]|nr:hypothetical protein [bacterium]
MTNNQLPEGVGKKIVEALKRQAEADISPMPENNGNNANTVPLTEIEDIPEIKYTNVLNEVSSENEIIEEEPVVYNQPVQTVTEPINTVTNTDTPIKSTLKMNSSIMVPVNVQKLNNLMNSLPVGVTKQTGALIIKQTMEAMGMSVSNVLKEAQSFQEELNASNKECLIKIQECKTQIMQLEATVQANQDNISCVNDIVSLFV